MEIGFVGLGRMGGNMTLRLLKRGHRVVAFDLSDTDSVPHTAISFLGFNLIGTPGQRAAAATASVVQVN